MTSKGNRRYYHDGAANTAMLGPRSKRTLKPTSTNGANPFVWGAVAIAGIVGVIAIIGGLGYAYVSYSERNDVEFVADNEVCSVRMSGVTISVTHLVILDNNYDNYEILLSTKRHTTTLDTRKTVVDSTGPFDVLERFEYDTPFPNGCEVKVRGIPG